MTNMLPSKGKCYSVSWPKVSVRNYVTVCLFRPTKFPVSRSEAPSAGRVVQVDTKGIAVHCNYTAVQYTRVSYDYYQSG